MANQTITGNMIQRNDTGANWSVANPILAKGEIGVNTDDYRMKIGNGVTTWNNLLYEDILTTNAFDTLATDTVGVWNVTIPKITSLYDGLTIRIRLLTSYNGTYNTLNVNGLGAKLVWYRINERLTSHVPRYAELSLTYRTNAGSYVYGSTTYTGGWVLQTHYMDGNTWNDMYYSENINLGETIYGYDLLLKGANNKWYPVTKKTSDTATSTTTGNSNIDFLINSDILWYVYGTDCAAGNLSTYLTRITTPSTINYPLYGTFTQYKNVYLVGTIVGGNFRIDSTNYWTHDLPTTENNKVYIYLGYMSTANTMRLSINHPIYWFKDGVVQPYATRQIVNTSTATTGLTNGHYLYNNNGVIGAAALPTSLPANGGNADTVDNKHASDFAAASHMHDPQNISGGYTTSQFYVDTHPENAGAIIPFVNNDIAFLLSRGGSISCTKNDVAFPSDFNPAFDGTPSYWSGSGTIAITDIFQFELTLHTTFSWTNTIGISFGASAWRAKSIKIEVMNSIAGETTWTTKANVTEWGFGQYFIRMSHNEGTGFNKIRFTLTNFNTTSFRIAQIFVLNYGSKGMSETFVSRGGGTLYGSLIPQTNNNIDLGSSSNNYRSIYATNFYGTVANSDTVDGKHASDFAASSHLHTIDNITDIAVGTCSTAISTAAKTLTVTNFVLRTGAIALVKFTYGNTAASPTLNINSTGAKPIFYNGVAVPTDLIVANDLITLMYDGTNWVVNGVLDYGTATSGLTSGGTGSVGSSNKIARADHTHTLPAYPTIPTSLPANGGNADTVDGKHASDFATASHNHTIANISDIGVGTCSTAAATAGKVLTVTNFTLTTNSFVIVKFAYTNTAPNPTLNVNGTGAKFIFYNGTVIPSDLIVANDLIVMMYDGTNWVMSGSLDYATTTTTLSGGGTGTVGTSSRVARADHTHTMPTIPPGNPGTGINSVVLNSSSNTASAKNAVAEGLDTISSGLASHAEGGSTLSSGDCAHSEGLETQASGSSSHAEGIFSIASGDYSHAEGYTTITKGYAAHAEGGKNIAIGPYTHAEGGYNIAISGAMTTEISGNSEVTYTSLSATSVSITHKSGTDWWDEYLSEIKVGRKAIMIYYTGNDYNCLEFTVTSITINSPSINIVFDLSNSFFYENLATRTPLYLIWDIGEYLSEGSLGSHVEGTRCTAIGDSSHTEGACCAALRSFSHAEGYFSTASGSCSHAEGANTKASGPYSHSEGDNTIASGPYSHSQGYFTTASGAYSCTEGYRTISSGTISHAEGANTTASGPCSHAEGNATIASGPYSHSQGYFTTASEPYSHAEGYKTQASGPSSHAEGNNTIASGESSHAEGYNTFAASGEHVWKVELTPAVFSITKISNDTIQLTCVDTEGDIIDNLEISNIKSVSLVFFDELNQRHNVLYGIVESCDLDASSYTFVFQLKNSDPNSAAILLYKFVYCIFDEYGENNSHAEGYKTIALAGSHAEGFNTAALSLYSHAEGCSSVAEGYYSHAEGFLTKTKVTYSHAEGAYTIASGSASHAEGISATASGYCSHAEGNNTTASGSYSHAEGTSTIASGYNSHAEGYVTTAETYLGHVQGRYNKVNSGSASSYSTTNNAFVVGNGSSATTKSNAFRITYAGAAYGLSAFNSTGADYAEYFEWEDGNPNDEDRVGLFVTLSEDKIKIAQEDDAYILGAISGNASVIGNAHEDQWNEMYARDEFGRFIYEYVDVPAKYEIIPAITKEHTTENGETVLEVIEKEQQIFISPAGTEKRIKLNPNYDPDLEYVPRSERKEWDTVGMLGQLIVKDDGTCIPNSYCKCGKNGLATYSNEGYRVLKRLSENVIVIILK